MATARLVPVKHKIVEDEKIVLELDRDEAEFVLSVLSRIGGNPDTLRRYQTRISGAIRGALGYRDYELQGLGKFSGLLTGSIECLTDKEF